MRGKGEASDARFDDRGSQRRLKPHVGAVATSHLACGMQLWHARSMEVPPTCVSRSHVLAT